MKKIFLLFILIPLILCGCESKENLNEENDIFKNQIKHEMVNPYNKLFICSRTQTDNDGVIIKTDETIELDPNDTLVKYGTIMSQYTKDKFDYYCNIIETAKNNIDKSSDKGHYYIINCDKENNVISGGQFYIPEEMESKKEYNMSNIYQYINEYNEFSIRKWKENLTNLKYECK